MEGKLELISRYDEYYLVKSISNEDILLDDILLHNESCRIISVNRFGESNGSKTIIDAGVRNPIELVITGNTFKKLIGYYSEYQKLPLSNLSLKNCEAIANGYDLDELVKERFGETFWHDGDKHFKEGFQKALEILGDKKFSADEIIKAYNDGWSLNYDYFQSLQQTEWDVEICCQNDCYGDYTTCKKSSFECQICTNTGIPKLDEDGCLILRRK